MKNPGTIKAGTKEHHAIIDFTKVVSEAFDISEAAALGQLLKFYDALGKACESPIGVSSLKIYVEDSKGL